MKKTSIICDKDYQIGSVDPRLFGGFVEHMGRCVYGGIYEPTHPTADRLGFRQDVMQLIRGLHMSILRYPGGNFVSGYHWRDGVGPREKRPCKLNLAWNTLESNQVGTDEFCVWANKLGAEVMLSVNLGTGTPQEAADLVEYTNHPGGTQLSNLRIQNGYPSPHDVKLWCLGNEMDGPWQIGHKKPGEYAQIAKQAAKLMKAVDPSIELVACGSTNSGMPLYPTWDAEVLSECIDEIDFLSMHTYYDNIGGTLDDLLSRSLLMEKYINEIVATCDYSAARSRSKKQVCLSYDEWGVWFSRSDTVAEPNIPLERWGEAVAMVEGTSNLAEAVLAGTMIIRLLQHADRIKIACISELVNVIAPIVTVPGGVAFANSIYFPFAMTAALARDTISLQTIMDSPKHSTRYFDDVSMVECAAQLAQDDTLYLFLANRNLSEEAFVDIELRGFKKYSFVTHEVLTHSDPTIENTAYMQPIYPKKAEDPLLEGSHIKVVLPPCSFSSVRVLRQDVI